MVLLVGTHHVLLVYIAGGVKNEAKTLTTRDTRIQDQRHVTQKAKLCVACDPISQDRRHVTQKAKLCFENFTL